MLKPHTLAWVIMASLAYNGGAQAASMPCRELFRALTGRTETFTSRSGVFEIGPGHRPLCEDCGYLDLQNDFFLFSPQWWRLRTRDIRNSGLKSNSVDVFYSRGLPWFGLANLRHRYRQTISVLRFLDVNGLSDHELSTNYFRAHHDFLLAAVTESFRVLKPGGSFFVLYEQRTGEKESPLRADRYLIDTIDMAQAVGFAYENIVHSAIKSLRVNGIELRKPLD